MREYCRRRASGRRQPLGQAAADLSGAALRLSCDERLRLELSRREQAEVYYREGVFIGYRHFEREGLAPLFPFDFGLSYTTFDYGEVSLSSDRFEPGGTLRVRVPVTNSGARAGAEVVPLYVCDVQASAPRPEKELKRFVKVPLEPGETEVTELSLNMRALTFFNEAQNAWVAEAGDFKVLVGASSSDIRERLSFALTAIWRKTVGTTRPQ